MFSSERAMEVIFLFYLGIPATDGIIREDSWKYSAYRALESYVNLKAQEKAMSGLPKAPTGGRGR